MPEPEVW